MNTSGPSSRPRKPYPLALLNHLTVPFSRSTCVPPIFAHSLESALPEALKRLGIVLLAGRPVKTLHHSPLRNSDSPRKLLERAIIYLTDYNYLHRDRVECRN